MLIFRNTQQLSLAFYQHQSRTHNKLLDNKETLQCLIVYLIQKQLPPAI